MSDAILAEILLPTQELRNDLPFYTKTLGMRLENIFPADNPSVASLSGHGLRVRIDKSAKVSQAQAEDAVRVLLEWAGEDPTREGLLDTPKRVAKAYRDWFSGYQMDPREYLARTFEEVEGYDDLIILKDISFESHCEHHLAPIIEILLQERARLTYVERQVIQPRREPPGPRGIGRVRRAVHPVPRRLVA